MIGKKVEMNKIRQNYHLEYTLGITQRLLYKMNEIHLEEKVSPGVYKFDLHPPNSLQDPQQQPLEREHFKTIEIYSWEINVI